MEDKLSPRVPRVKADISDEEAAKIDEKIKFDAAVREAEKSLLPTIWRYRDFSIDDYQIYDPKQKPVVDRIIRIGRRIDAFIDTKRHNLILYGSYGTGKDLLATWVLRAAASRGHICRWVEAREMYEELLCAFQHNSSTDEVFRAWTYPKVLCLSDPVFRDGWRDKYYNYLSSIVRRRYNRGRLTWVTANYDNEHHAEKLFGSDVWSRLSHNAVKIEMTWKDFRRNSFDKKTQDKQTGKN